MNELNEDQIILAQTAKWVVVNKPVGWLTIPGRGSEPAPPVLKDWLAKRLGKEIWVVHRLDLETSGVLLFALTADAHREACVWFEKHQIKKTYDCLAVGAPQSPTFRVSHPIEGSRAITQVEVRERWKEGFLARVRIVTGKRHQIRIHLSKEGNPIWGDRMYGGPKQVLLEKNGKGLRVERVALHSARLELPTQEVFEAPWPADFTEWVSRVREEGTRVV